MNLGDKIKQSRMSMGLSQDQLAQKLSVNVQTVAAWENSQSIPDDEKLNLLKNILNFEDLTYSTEPYKDNNKIYYNDIERIFMLKNWLLLQINGQYFIVRKNDLKENSVFYSMINSNSLNNAAFDGIGIYRNVSIALNVLSILSLPIAYTVAQSISSVEGTLPENMWVAFLFLPLPVLSIVYGIVMTAKGGKFKANIVNGSIFALLLFIFGMYYVMF